MRIFRNIAGVVVGYLVFGISAALLFKVGGIDPHADAGALLIAGTCVIGAVFAFAGGYLAKRIAATRGMSVNVILAAIMAGFAAFSMAFSSGSRYTQLATILLFAPASLLGGIVGRRAEKY